MGKLTFKDEIIGIKYILEDGTEIEAKVVLEDATLGIAFVGPAKPLTAEQKERLKPIPISAEGNPEVKALDKLIAINRLGKSMRRTISVSTIEVAAVITKPRTFYYPGTSIGSPVFDLSGNLVGINRLEAPKKASKSMLGSQLMGAPEMTICSAKDVASLLPQAKEALKGEGEK